MFLTATLPGVVFAFLPFQYEVTPLEAMDPALLGAGWALAVSVAFAPLVLVALDTWRLPGLSVPPVAAWLVAIYGALTWVAWCWYAARRLLSCAEVGLMGTFVCVVGSLAVPSPGTLVDLQAGGYLGLYVCVVLLLRIVITVRPVTM